MTSPTKENRRQELVQAFIEAMDVFAKGTISSRGLALQIERLTTTDELNEMDDDLLVHAFWVARHLLHRPACWAPGPTELKYVYHCLKGEEEFNQEVADSFRQ